MVKPRKYSYRYGEMRTESSWETCFRVHSRCLKNIPFKIQTLEYEVNVNDTTLNLKREHLFVGEY